MNDASFFLSYISVVAFLSSKAKLGNLTVFSVGPHSHSNSDNIMVSHCSVKVNYNNNHPAFFNKTFLYKNEKVTFFKCRNEYFQLR